MSAGQAEICVGGGVFWAVLRSREGGGKGFGGCLFCRV